MPKWMKRQNPTRPNFQRSGTKRHYQTVMHRAFNEAKRVSVEMGCPICGAVLEVQASPQGTWLACVECKVRVKLK